MQFPTRDFTLQYISSSYQDVLQRYDTGATQYILDGLGTVVFSFPSSSIGNSLITSDMTSSLSVATASYSFLSNYAISSSYSTTSSFSNYALNAFYADSSANAIYAITGENATYIFIYATTTSNTRYFVLTDAPIPPLIQHMSAVYSPLIKCIPKYGSITCTSLTSSILGNIQGTSSYAVSASWAPSIPSDSASYATTSSYSVTASYVLNNSSYLPTYNTASIQYTGPYGQISTASYYNNVTLVANVIFLYDTSGNFTGSTKFIY